MRAENMIEIGVYNGFHAHMDTIGLPAVPSKGDLIEIGGMMWRVSSVEWQGRKVPAVKIIVE